MSWRSHLYLTKTDREVRSITEVFLTGRLEEPRTLQWATELTRDRQAERAAVLWLLERRSEDLTPAWRDTWRLIQMYWQAPIADSAHSHAYRIRRSLRSGDRSAVSADEIAKHLAPWVKVDFRDDNRGRRKIKSPTDLLSLQMTSHKLVPPDAWGVDQLRDHNFLFTLTQRLTHELKNALATGTGIGWETDRHWWRYGSPRRVGYIDDDPDEFTRGITPLVKMLHFAVVKLSTLSPELAKNSVANWDSPKSLIFRRLWAAVALNRNVASSEAVTTFLSSLSSDEFWGLHKAPEFFELRARRFGDLGRDAQSELVKRIRRLPPRRHWKRAEDRSQIPHYQRYWAVRELRRIEAAGWGLPASSKAWLQRELPNHPELSQDISVDHAFSIDLGVRAVHTEPEMRFDDLFGEKRLEALQAALSSPRKSFDDDSAERARAWIRIDGNPQKLIADFEGAADFGAACPKVWDAFGWAYKRSSAQRDLPAGDPFQIQREVERVLALLSNLPDASISKAISGIAWWLAACGRQVVASTCAEAIWTKIWPLAVDATNDAHASRSDEDFVFDTAIEQETEEHKEIDTRNNPAGRFVDLFETFWSAHVERGAPPFGGKSAPRRLRNSLFEADGHAGLVVRCRLAAQLNLLLRDDEAWTKENLVPLLEGNDDPSLQLWTALGRRRLFRRAIMALGDRILERAVDHRLGRTVRSNLVFSVVVEFLHSLKDDNAPAIQRPRLQHFLRSPDDELRSTAIHALDRFMKDVPKRDDDDERLHPEAIFDRVANPFLTQVWPQERALASPGVAKGLAELPAACGERFAEAASVVERFLVPFDCWSLLDYGLYGEDGDGRSRLEMIDTASKAKALLSLLGRTIGSGDDAIIPRELGDALEQIARIDPVLEKDPTFRRLTVAAR